MNMIHVTAERDPAPDRRQRRREARSEAILEIAMRLVGEKGLGGLTLQHIAAELDCAIGAFYRYFPSKGALLAELQRRVVIVLHAKLRACRRHCTVWTSDNRTATEVAALMPVIAVALLYEGLARNAPAQFGMLSLSLGDPRRLIDDTNARRVAQATGPIFAEIADDLAAAESAGALSPDTSNDDTMANAGLLWAALHGVVQLRKLEDLDPTREPTAVAALRLVRTLLVGWGASAAAVDEAADTLARQDAEELSITAADFATAPSPPVLDTTGPNPGPREQ